MASLNREPNGHYTIQLVCADTKRRSIRLGPVNKKTAEAVKTRVEAIHTSAVANLPMEAETAAWVANIGDDLAEKLAAVGLIPNRAAKHLAEFLSTYTERRKADAKGSTLTNLNTVRNDLVGFFGSDRALRSVTVEHAEEFKTHMLTRTPKLAAATVARRLTTVRMLFKQAVRLKLIETNPFAEVAARSVLPTQRKAYISPSDTEKVLAACDPTWRIIVALARYAGLRCPSEVLSVKWSDVNFETERITVPSCKTEHLPGKAYRVVPIFAALKPYLDEAFELAEAGAEYVVPGNLRDVANRPGGWVNCNLRTKFLKIIKRAGLQSWPRLFHSLRASCETDLMAHHPIHTVVSWLGNMPTVALKHYLQVLDSDFEKAAKGGAESGAVVVQKEVQSRTAASGQKTTRTPQVQQSVGVGRPLSISGTFGHEPGMGVEGFEPPTSSL